MKNTEITNTEDIIDSRDVIARIDDLQDTLSRLETAIAEAETDEDRDDAQTALDEWNDSDERAELENLLRLQTEADGSPDWHHGETLIRDSYFEDYARELAEDCCDMPKDARWPMCHIDWPAAAAALQQDYTSVSFDGVDYWIRA